LLQPDFLDIDIASQVGEIKSFHPLATQSICAHGPSFFHVIVWSAWIPACAWEHLAGGEPGGEEAKDVAQRITRLAPIPRVDSLAPGIDFRYAHSNHKKNAIRDPYAEHL
jgi:hypothetical protein